MANEDYLRSLLTRYSFGSELMAYFGGTTATLSADGFGYKSINILDHPESLLDYANSRMEALRKRGTPSIVAPMPTTPSPDDEARLKRAMDKLLNESFGPEAMAAQLERWRKSKAELENDPIYQLKESILENDPIYQLKESITEGLRDFGWILAGVALIAVGGYALMKGS